jgi:hypothetical protein
VRVDDDGGTAAHERPARVAAPLAIGAPADLRIVAGDAADPEGRQAGRLVGVVCRGVILDVHALEASSPDTGAVDAPPPAWGGER